MPVDLSEKVKQLNTVRIFDYFKKKSMPEFVEPYVTELVDRFTSCSEAERNQLLSLMSRESPVFGWYARKLAGRAIRDNSQKDLWNGLMALVIFANKTDFRDLMAPLALLHHSALRLQQDTS